VQRVARARDALHAALADVRGPYADAARAQRAVWRGVGRAVREFARARADERRVLGVGRGEDVDLAWDESESESEASSEESSADESGSEEE
jgi:hypothetical protein